MADFQKMYEGIDKLHQFVLREPELSDFGPAVSELRETALAAANGDREIPRLRQKGASAIPHRELAEELVRIVGTIPGITDGDDEQDVMAVARLLANVADAVIHAIFNSFPDVVPHEVAE